MSLSNILVGAILVANPLMVLADHSFREGGGGGVILRSLLAAADLGRIICVTPRRLARMGPVRCGRYIFDPVGAAPRGLP